MIELDFVALILRIWVGVVMLAHGINHARSLDGTARWFAKVGFRSPKVNAWMSAVAELAMGAGLITGLLTPFAAAGVAATMLVAFWSIHRFAGFFVFHRPDEGYEFVVTLTVAALVIALLGPGAYSLDAAFGLDDFYGTTLGALALPGGSFDVNVGLVVFAGGLLAGAAQLAVFWRKPDAAGREQ